MKSRPPGLKKGKTEEDAVEKDLQGLEESKSVFWSPKDPRRESETKLEISSLIRHIHSYLALPQPWDL